MSSFVDNIHVVTAADAALTHDAAHINAATLNKNERLKFAYKEDIRVLVIGMFDPIMGSYDVAVPCGTYNKDDGYNPSPEYTSLANRVTTLENEFDTAFVGADSSFATLLSNFNTHQNDTTKHITAAERSRWNGKQDQFTDGTVEAIDALSNQIIFGTTTANKGIIYKSGTDVNVVGVDSTRMTFSSTGLTFTQSTNGSITFTTSSGSFTAADLYSHLNNSAIHDSSGLRARLETLEAAFNALKTDYDALIANQIFVSEPEA